MGRRKGIVVVSAAVFFLFLSFSVVFNATAMLLGASLFTREPTLTVPVSPRVAVAADGASAPFCCMLLHLAQVSGQRNPKEAAHNWHQG